MSDCRQVAQTYFYDGDAISIEATLDGYSSYDLDTQFLIFRCATEYMHPPLMQFTPLFAGGGMSTARYLEGKLRQGQSSRTTMHILEVFADAQRQGAFDATQDPELMILLRQSVADHRGEPWHERSQRLLQEIEQARSFPP